MTNARDVIAKTLRENCSVDFLVLNSDECAEEILDALIASGLAVVPMVATEEMVNAFLHQYAAARRKKVPVPGTKMSVAEQEEVTRLALAAAIAATREGEGT